VSSTDSVPALLVRLWHHSDRRYQRQFILLLGLMFVSALAEAFSLGAVVPFLGVLVAPEAVFKHPAIAGMARALAVTSADRLVLPLTLVFGAAALLAGVIRMTLLWASTRFTFAIGADLSLEVYRRTLYQPYQRYHEQGGYCGAGGITATHDPDQLAHTANFDNDRAALHRSICCGRSDSRLRRVLLADYRALSSAAAS
jgi:ABC-type multidrug transport system fused ATPase/permease subunit